MVPPAKVEEGGRPAEHRLPATPSTVHTGFWDNSLEPVLAIDSGDIVSIETMMLMDGQLQPGLSIEDILRLRGAYTRRGVSSHTLTGPILVRGAAPGDVLEVRILRLVPYPMGVNYCLPGAEGAGALPEEFPDGRLWDCRWHEGSQEVAFGNGVCLPLRPFLGTMGVAPREPGRRKTMPPGAHGGNMDLRELVEGTTLYLPVFVSGALFSTGDAHALQGDGEANVTALETAMREARLQFIVRRDMPRDTPLAETPTHWITMGFDPDLDEAARAALREAIAWLVRNVGLSRERAYALCSMAVDLRVTQMVDGNKGVHAMIPRAIFTGSRSPVRTRSGRPSASPSAAPPATGRRR